MRASSARLHTETQAGAPPWAADYWTAAWQEASSASPFKASQSQRAGQWREFYDQVGQAWLHAWGQPWTLGEQVTSLLLKEGLVSPGRSVLDLGCGPGAIAAPLAHAGVKVTALDSAPGMIEAVRDEAQRRGLDNLRAQCQCWSQLIPLPQCDLALAAFFPPALSPAGLSRLEALSRKHCALVLGCGEEPFAFRRELWEKVMQEPYPSGGFHLACALNYLLALGRRPNLRHLEWQGRLDRPLDEAQDFYRRYFALFGREGQAVEQDIAQVLAAHAQGGRLRAQGLVRVALLWWEKP